MTIQQRTIDVTDSENAAALAKAEAETLEAIANTFTVATVEDFEAANNELIAIKNKIREYEKKRVEMKAPVLEAGRKVDEFFQVAIAPLKRAETIIKNQMIAYQREQERLRREAEEAARKEVERAERARIKAIEKGDVEKVAKAEERVVQAAATIAEAPVVPKAKGFYVTEIWTANVIDFMALVKAVAAGKQPLDLLLPNQSALDDLAKAHTTNLAVPGVLAVKRDSAGSRAR